MKWCIVSRPRTALITCAFLCALGGSLITSSHGDDLFSVTSFVDTYSSYQHNDNSSGTRPYSTQAVKNGGYHLNLGSGGLTYDDGSIIAKVVGQYGNSVDVNYAAEPHEAFRFIQESFFGVHLNEDTTIDAGIFLSHIGGESWLSKDNLTYTRSFIAEFSPYYESGIRLSHSLTKATTIQILALNGWQNISDNRHPALGGLVSYTHDTWTLALNNFIGSEEYGTRVFHDLSIRRTNDDGFSLQGAFDFGYQSPGSTHDGVWWGCSLIAKQRLVSFLSLVGRVESYQDPNNIIVASATHTDFQAYSSSVGLDISLGWGFALRNEAKLSWSPNPIFLNGSTPRDNDMLFVMSVSFSGDKKI